LPNVEVEALAEAELVAVELAEAEAALGAGLAVVAD